jgi:hypothetical protein
VAWFISVTRFSYESYAAVALNTLRELFRLLVQKPKTARPLANNGKAAGSGVAKENVLIIEDDSAIPPLAMSY